jgi:hypothetical protein
VLNASSHFFGLILVIIGAIFMGVEARVRVRVKG